MEIFRMEWNMEEIFRYGMEKNCRYGIWKNRLLPFHSITCPGYQHNDAKQNKCKLPCCLLIVIEYFLACLIVCLD